MAANRTDGWQMYRGARPAGKVHAEMDKDAPHGMSADVLRGDFCAFEANLSVLTTNGSVIGNATGNSGASPSSAGETRENIGYCAKNWWAL